MYRIGRKKGKKTRKHVWLFVFMFTVFLCAAAGFLAYKIAMELQATEVTTPKEIVHEYAPPESNEKTFDQDLFQIKLPADWVFKGHTTDQYNRYSWQASAKNADNRWLDIYVDKTPSNMAFNRMYPVTVQSNRILPAGPVSDNCTAFTGSQGRDNAPDPRVPQIQTSWQDVSFWCDMSNYRRNVVGVGTVNAKEGVTLVSTSGVRHNFLIVYTDHNFNPDYNLLQNALKSITLH